MSKLKCFLVLGKKTSKKRAKQVSRSHLSNAGSCFLALSERNKTGLLTYCIFVFADM